MLLCNIGLGGTGGGIILLGKFISETDMFRGKGLWFLCPDPNFANAATSNTEYADFGAHLDEVSK